MSPFIAIASPFSVPISRFSLFRSVSRRCSLSPRHCSLWPSFATRRFPSWWCKRYCKSPRRGSRRTSRSAEPKSPTIAGNRSRRTVVVHYAGTPDRIDPVGQTKIQASPEFSLSFVLTNLRVYVSVLKVRKKKDRMKQNLVYIK